MPTLVDGARNSTDTRELTDDLRAELTALFILLVQQLQLDEYSGLVHALMIVEAAIRNGFSLTATNVRPLCVCAVSLACKVLYDEMVTTADIHAHLCTIGFQLSKQALVEMEAELLGILSFHLPGAAYEMYVQGLRQLAADKQTRFAFLDSYGDKIICAVMKRLRVSPAQSLRLRTPLSPLSRCPPQSASGHSSVHHVPCASAASGWSRRVC